MRDPPRERHPPGDPRRLRQNWRCPDGNPLWRCGLLASRATRCGLKVHCGGIPHRSAISHISPQTRKALTEYIGKYGLIPRYGGGGERWAWVAAHTGQPAGQECQAVQRRLRLHCFQRVGHRPPGHHTERCRDVQRGLTGTAGGARPLRLRWPLKTKHSFRAVRKKKAEPQKRKLGGTSSRHTSSALFRHRHAFYVLNKYLYVCTYICTAHIRME